MKLSELLKKVNVKNEYSDMEVTQITADSRKITKGCVFVCIKGAKFDGHLAAADAMENGAAAVIAEHPTRAGGEILVDNSREAYALMCAAYFGEPAEHLKLIGITGTNGKTTTALLIKGILDKIGVKSGLIGTVKNMIGTNEYPAVMTTPEAFELQELFANMVTAGCEYCIMEVSSQALAQGRVAGCHYSVAVFTNLTQDHLDYHGTMDNYAAAKAELFKNSDIGIVNLDDDYAMRMLEGSSCRRVTYSVNTDKSDYTAKNVHLYNDRISYELVGMSVIGRVKLNIPGNFTVYNSMAAAVAAVETGIDFNQVLEALETLSGVKGRIEVVPTDTEFTIIIDDAHTPDGLINILTALRTVAEGRILTVFGCGGDRDRGKRPIMGKIATDMSDIVYVTSDNPRSENPSAIINEIISGIVSKKTPVRVNADRTESIRMAIDEAWPKDIILLAGKGHETYQILNSGKIHYDEREVVAEILAARKG